MYTQYKYKFYLNANHAIYINNNLGDLHSHTWEMILNVTSFNMNFIQFNDIEKHINTVLDKYQNQNINVVEPFNKINPTLENICKYFNEEFISILKPQNIRLDSIEICESVTRSFIIINSDVETNQSMQEVNEEEMFIDDIISKFSNKKDS